MHRRTWIATAGRALLAAAGCGAALSARAQPTYSVSAAQLQRALDARFPRRQAIPGLLEIELRAPALHLLADENRVGSELPLLAYGPALSRRYAGSIELDFALRYESTDRTIRAHAIRVNAVRMEGLSRDGEALLDASARSLAQQSLVEVVLHQLRPEDLALAHTMGFEPDTITVTPHGLRIGFVPRP
jgi:hypothetical protein